MITENLSTLKIHKLTQAQYDRELAAGTIDGSALYLTPDEPIDLSGYATIEQLETKAATPHAHTAADVTDLQLHLDELLEESKGYTNDKIYGKADVEHTHNDIYYTEEEIDDKVDLINKAIADITNGATKVGNSIKADSSTTATYANSAVMADKLGSTTIGGENVPIYLKKGEPVNIVAVDIAHGGTGSVTAADARTNLDVYSKSEVDSVAVTAANTVKNNLLNGAGTAYDTLKELGDLIDENVDAIEALEFIASGKADANHTHNDIYYTEEEIDDKVAAIDADISNIVNGTTIVAKATNAETATALKGVTSNSYLVGNGTNNMIEKTPNEVWSHIKSAGKNVEGAVFVIDEKNVAAASGAEIFNDYDNNIATGLNSHAEGSGTIASGDYSHAEGKGTVASVSWSHAEGCDTTASNWGAHAEGGNTVASGAYAHAEGFGTTASSAWSHAEGGNTVASGAYAHAEGSDTIASGDYSHAEGKGTVASGDHSHAEGKFNVEDNSNIYAHIVGNGDSSAAPSNAHTLDWNGNAWFAGEVKIGGTSQDDANAKTLATKEELEALRTEIMSMIASLEEAKTYLNI